MDAINAAIFCFSAELILKKAINTACFFLSSNKSKTMRIRLFTILTGFLFFSFVGCLQAEKIKKHFQTTHSSMKTSTIHRKDSAEIKKVFDQIYQAMLDGNSGKLSSFFSDDFTLIHMTGKVQSKKEWLKDIDAKWMAYHSRKEVSNRIEFSNEGATLTGWDRVDATIYGGRGTWNLQLTVQFIKVYGSWIAQKMEATTF
jgi:hypothetical protein